MVSLHILTFYPFRKYEISVFFYANFFLLLQIIFRLFGFEQNYFKHKIFFSDLFYCLSVVVKIF